MNALQAISRLNLLRNVEKPLERAVEDTRNHGDFEGSHALKQLLAEIVLEKDNLEIKLSEINL